MADEISTASFVEETSGAILMSKGKERGRRSPKLVLHAVKRLVTALPRVKSEAGGILHAQVEVDG
jgi:hypothetical protein